MPISSLRHMQSTASPPPLNKVAPSSDQARPVQARLCQWRIDLAGSTYHNIRLDNSYKIVNVQRVSKAMDEVETRRGRPR